MVYGIGIPLNMRTEENLVPLFLLIQSRIYGSKNNFWRFDPLDLQSLGHFKRLIVNCSKIDLKGRSKLLSILFIQRIYDFQI